jgi:hypothetical protein
MNKFLTFFTFLVFTSGTLKSQTQNDTIFNYITKTPVTIDGKANEECWANAEWHNMHQVLIPYGATMEPGDFEGKFKVAWDEQYLYILVEVVDDSLSDNFSNPLQDWWNDDCVEIFIDENRSKGEHERNNNAFAYHVSLIYDAIDSNSSGGGVNYKDNIEVDMDTISEKTYLWEFAIKNYSASFDINNPEASRVLLEPNKPMGFAIAYCDNDGNSIRENFIGSMTLTSGTHNDLYKNADHFGPMILIDPDYVETPSGIANNLEKINVYPNPANSQITLTTTTKSNHIKSYTLSSITGQVVKSGTFIGNSQIINIEDLNSGIYLLNANFATTNFSKLIIKE